MKYKWAFMRKAVISLSAIITILSCTATFISVRHSDRTAISTTVDQDSMRIGGGQWDWDDNNSINFDRSKDKRHYKNDSLE